jgi:peptide/nickel transport system substrate-binding protein
MLSRRGFISAAAGAASLPMVTIDARAASPLILRVGMTASDVPLTTGQANQGGEGVRFIGYSLYDPLIRWDLSRSDISAPLAPGLAVEWSVSPDDKKTWTFKLRQGVLFHDGSPFTADAVIWNLDKLMNKAAPQYDSAQAAQASQYFLGIQSYRKIDDYTVAMVTKVPDAVFPYQISGIVYSSPKRWEEVGNSWAEFAKKASGTGPWILDKLVARERAELVKNAKYWDAKRVPKSDRLVLLCMPDSSTRTAALLSGQADFIEAPPPDAVPRLKQASMQIVTNVYPHIWPYQLSFLDDSPFKDVRVRKAANLAIDREGLCKFLGGLAIPATGQVPKGHPWYGKPSFEIKYDPAAAAKLMKEAGYDEKKKLKVKFGISTSGSGQMQPLPMNEFIQENLNAVGFDVEFEVLEWETLRGRRRDGAFAPSNKGVNGINNSWAFTDPDIGILGISMTRLKPPAGFNWGAFSDPEIDALGEKAKQTFDAGEFDKIMAEIHGKLVDKSLWIWVVHDLNPRALGPKVKGFVQAQSWYQDLTPVWVDS